MTYRRIILVALLLLLLTGCRSLRDKEQPNSGDTPSVSSSAAAPGTPEPAASDADDKGASSGEDSGAMPSPSGTESAASSPALPSGPADHTAAPSAAAATAAALPSGKMASQEDVNATLDDILKELGDLDKLYSQMDNLSETDLK